ncbi:MAG: SRPBCC domain-containing protein [Pseudomonadota bacterium]
MTDQDFHRTIAVAAGADRAYAALTQEFGGWWTRTATVFAKPGDIVTFEFPPQRSYWTFAAKALEPGRRVEMECVEALHLIDDKPDADPEEWLGTRVEWIIAPRDGGTMITVWHKGLRPELDCYEICSSGWDRFFVDSLQAYLTTGKGMPHGG